MNGMEKDITADAIALQERDEFRSQGWLKLIAPAKVNLHLAIGAKRPDGYHDAATVLHTLSLHDVVYMRRRPGGGDLEVRMVAQAGIEVPDLLTEDNIAARAIERLANETGNEHDCALEVRIDKGVPAQAGLGGGSSDAAAALVGAAHLWGIAPDDPVLEKVARTLGADVAFFLHGGCAYLEGTGDELVHTLEPSRRPIALVKPEGGVSTAAAYRAFDEHPVFAGADRAEAAFGASRADDVTPFNNLAAASEALMPELAEIREQLLGMEGVSDVLLCGSGSCTFALCDDFSTACKVASEAKKRGYWSRTTSLSPARTALVSS